ncbi:TIGR03086 family metal-binding protein [Mycolicibacterium thermoresistibile]
MPMNGDLLRLHRSAIETTVDLVDTLATTDLHRPTPCAGWNLADLLAHMTVQHRGFAAAARGHGGDEAVWDVTSVAETVSTDPSGAYAAAAAEVLAAFAAHGALDRPFAIPEFGPGVEIPGAQAIRFHLVDYVVHGWDVAAALGVRFAIGDDVIEAALPITLGVPDGAIRDAENSPFAPAVPLPAGCSDLDRMLAHLGRSPGWTASRPGRR